MSLLLRRSCLAHLADAEVDGSRLEEDDEEVGERSEIEKK